MLGYIDRFGVEAVMGRSQLRLGEMRRMLTVENIVTAYKSRRASENWAKWADEHKFYAELLANVERLNAAD